MLILLNQFNANLDLSSWSLDFSLSTSLYNSLCGFCRLDLLPLKREHGPEAGSALKK